LVDLARSYEIIYKARNHASGRREFHLAPNMTPHQASRADSGNDRTRILLRASACGKVFAFKIRLN